MKKKMLISLVTTLILSQKTGFSQEVLAFNNPWGFYSIQWTFNSDLLNVARIDIPFEILEDVPDDYQLYVQVGQGSTIDGMPFYGGLQTNVMNHGNGALFSRWAQNDGKPNQEKLTVSDVSNYQYYEIGDYEGNFCSVRRNYTFSKGRYIISLIKNGKWVNYKINGVLVGSINFKNIQWNLEPYLIAFLEVYGGGNNQNKNIESDEIPFVNITFERPIVSRSDGEIFTPTSAYVNVYGRNETNGKVADIVKTTVLDNGINTLVDWRKLKYKDEEVGEWIKFK